MTASSHVWTPFKTIGIFVILLNQAKSFQLSPGSMKEEMARAAPWFFSTLSPEVVWTDEPSAVSSNF